MQNVQTRMPGSVAQRLHGLAELYEQGQASPLMDQTLRKLCIYEAETVQTQLAQLQADLADFERQYGLVSADFYRRFQSGQTDDRMDYVEWASLVQMQENAQKRLNLLSDLVLA